ncbi:5'-3' exonuclease [Flindersiella endophytica]
MADQPPLVLVDGNNLLWRSEFGFPARILSRDKTRDVTGVFGFFALLRKGIRENVSSEPEVVVCFDGEGGAARRIAVDPAYKANRSGADLTPILGLPHVQRGLDAFGVPHALLDDEEADDLIATYADQAGADGREVYIFSRDKDFFQLLDDRVWLLDTGRAAEHRLIGPHEVEQRFGLLPAQWCDRAALVGDPSDNLPGVRGVGPIRAARYLAGGLPLAELPGSGRLTGKTGQTVLDSWPDVERWRGLVEMRGDLRPPHDLTGQSMPELPLAAVILEELCLW